ncbi:hypothetical protein B0I00_2615 [Novosphingobium kunmingense]|uniref:DoxX-like protein n=1 Tax=Novosphingobium kunmingense TaxID=1211806 RepID=A0A2N0H4Y5_9SPHN|nr:hypothetical protein [Novosphingobium kunmingense]PKB13987.1 hypothetical protein B0I00_2615 [Novosphingobium kunmingense]
MALILTFLFGVANFILHRAVLDSGHPLLETMAGFFQLMGGRAAFVLEFALLLGAMLLVGQGREGWAWFYAAYTGANALAAWLILSGRV